MKRISDMTEMGGLRQIISSAIGNAPNQDIYVTGKGTVQATDVHPSWLKATDTYCLAHARH